LETNPRPAPNPKWRMTDHSKTIPLRIQLGFRPVPAPWLVCHPRWRRQQESNLHGLGRPSRGSSPISTPLRVSKNGGRRSIETQERKPLICFRGSDRLPACYTFQHLCAGPRVFRSARLRRVPQAFIGIPRISAQIARADACGKIHVVAMVSYDYLLRRLSRRSLVAGEMAERDGQIRPELRNSCSAEEKMQLTGYGFLRQSLPLNAAPNRMRVCGAIAAKRRNALRFPESGHESQAPPRPGSACSGLERH
jgi:hypothetical protein